MDKLYFLDQDGSRILSCRTDGSELRTVVVGCANHPDGIVIDDVSGYIYWTNMGRNFKRPDGSIERARLDGSERRTIVAEGLTFTPKQIAIDQAAGLLYWCDREGMRVMRARLDGSGIEVLVQTGSTDDERLDARNWCVGIELIFDGLPEPVDLDRAPDGELLWTDRAMAPHGGSVQQARVGDDAGPRLLAADLGEAIGVAVDDVSGRMFIATLQGKVFAMNPDGSGLQAIVRGAGRLTGICYHREHD